MPEPDVGKLTSPILRGLGDGNIPGYPTFAGDPQDSPRKPLNSALYFMGKLERE
ncbi:MAG: hypothetical protein GY749_47655 [Desulfobacteraceae bacterium]|nr:hypothetical protein [Desulfobacteraceae bacterium]